MKDTRDTYIKFFDKYGININEVNLFSLYKINDADITQTEIEEKIVATRKRFQENINSVKEDVAERNKNHMKYADKYELILRNEKLRNELFVYYSSKTDTVFAEKYFAIIATTKRIGKNDIDFYFSYFGEERKHKKEILKMLETQFKVKAFEKDCDHDAFEDHGDFGDKSQNGRSDSIVIVNDFQISTILKLRKCEQYYKSASNTPELFKYDQRLSNSMYNYLDLDKMSSLEDMNLVVDKRDKVFSLNQEKGHIFSPLVDLFNTIEDLLKQPDVADNFNEFKLLIKYPKLTPYMFLLSEVKEKTLKSLYQIAHEEYSFRNMDNFILDYYNKVYSNFGIDSTYVLNKIRHAEKNAKENDALNAIGKKLDFLNSNGIPFKFTLAKWLAYWPVLLTYAIFEFFKTVLTKLKLFVIPIGLFAFSFFDFVLPKVYGEQTVFDFVKDCFTKGFAESLGIIMYEDCTSNWLLSLIATLSGLVIFIIIYILPTFAATYFAYCATRKSDGFVKDKWGWKGREKTFAKLFGKIENKHKTLYDNRKETIISTYFKTALVNLLLSILIITIVIVVI